MNYLIKNIKKTKNNYVITLNDDTKLKMNEDVFTDYYFYVGKEISKDELNDIKMNMDISKSYQYALNLVLNKPYSAYNLYLKLINNKKLDKTTANKIIDKLKSYKYLDDTRYACDLIDELNYKGYGYFRIIEIVKKNIVDNNLCNIDTVRDVNVEYTIVVFRGDVYAHVYVDLVYAVNQNDTEGMQTGHLEYLIPIPSASVSYGESETPK